MSYNELKFTMTNAEYKENMQNYVFISKQMTKTTVRGIVLFLFLSIVIIIREGAKFSYVGMATLSAAGVLMAIYLYYIKPHMLAKKYGELKHYCYTFTDDMVAEQIDDKKETNTWKRYPEACVTKDYYYLFHYKGDPIILPKRAFEDMNQITEFTEFVKGKTVKFREEG